MDLAWTKRVARIAALGAMVALTACDGDEGPTAPLAPGGGQGNGGRPLTPTGSKADAGRASFDDDDDAGVSLEDAPLDCVNVEAVPFTGEDPTPGMLLNATDAPDDFVVTRVAIGFEQDCDQPTVILAVGDGRCPDGDGHELVFAIDGGEVEKGRLIGQYAFGDAKQSVQVRYHRPDRLRGAGMFGCEGTSGTIGFSPLSGLSDGDRFEGEYNLSLPPCEGADEDAGSQILRGTFAAELKRSFTEVCGDEP